MSDEETYREKFEKFVETVDLDSYRKKYNPVKFVEMNLPKTIQIIKLLYDTYWKDKRFIDFEQFYDEYFEAHKTKIEEYRRKITMCEDCFHRGLRARMNRTWTSIITQIQGGYVTESVFGSGTVEMSEELDRKGADIRVTYKDKKINYQVKKESYSGVIGRPKEVKKQLDGEDIVIEYCIIDKNLVEKQKKNGGYYAAYKWFLSKKKELGLEILKNGFVIFTPAKFELKKREIDAS